MINPATGSCAVAHVSSSSLTADQKDEAEADTWKSTPIYVIDDDPDVLSSTTLIIHAAGGSAIGYASGPDFFAAVPSLALGTILLDIRMAPMDGIQVLQELRQQGLDWPVIVITGHGDIQLAVETMKLGAMDFIEKPFDARDLFDRLLRAHRLLQRSAQSLELRRDARERISALTGRELAVLQALLTGWSNKDIAARYGTSPRTVETQRASMMARLRVDSIGAAFRLAVAAGVEPLT